MDIGFLQFYAFQEYQSIVIPIPVPTSSRACRGILKARCKRAYPPPQLHPRRILDAPAFWVLDVGFWVSSTLCFSRIPIPTSSRACLGILRARYKRAYLAIETRQCLINESKRNGSFAVLRIRLCLWLISIFQTTPNFRTTDHFLTSKVWWQIRWKSHFTT